MISAVAFACVSSDGVSVSGIEFTPELKACLGLSGLGSMIRKPFDEDAIEPSAPYSDAVKQHLQRVYLTSARIRLPPLSFKRNRSLGGITDMLINFDCLGVCFHELAGPGDVGFRVSGDIAQNAAVTETTNRTTNTGEANDDIATSTRSSVNFVKKPRDLLRYSRTFGKDRVLRIASRHKIKLLMLVEPPQCDHETRICLYTNPDDCDEIESAFQKLSFAQSLKQPRNPGAFHTRRAAPVIFRV